MARLVFDGDQFCGGVVIDSRFVLTARHCVEACPCFINRLDWRRCRNSCIVKLRVYDDFSTGSETLQTIENVFFPQGLPFVSRRVATDVFDIALIKLEKDINDCDGSSNCWPISPITLASPSTPVSQRSVLRALGWGAQDQTGVQSRYLRQVDLRLASMVDCRCPSFYELKTMIGADGRDACGGDSGGPLIKEEADGSFLLVGILSGGGLNCSSLGDPNYDWTNETGRWMRVSSFRDWLDSIIFQETSVIDGDWSEWGAWFSCSKECGGTQQRVRQCDDPKPRNGGQDCGDDFIQTRPCGGVCGDAEVGRGRGFFDIIQDAWKDLVGKQAEATASGLTNCTEKCLN